MNTSRTELERLDRDTLIARAEQSGVVRARILTRPELIDEIIVRAAHAAAGRADEVARVRGFFGRARDLLSRVIERGLHLPDAAERILARTLPPPPREGAPLPTVTLAEIYAAQGHRERAVATLKNVLDREPEHETARRLIERLEDAAYEGPAPIALPPEDEIFGVKPASEPTSAARVPATLRNVPDPAAPPEPPVAPEVRAREPREAPVQARTGARPHSRYGQDECVAIPVNREAVFVHWEVSEGTREHLLRTRPGGAFVLRLLVVSPTWDGPASTVRDVAVPAARGSSLFTGLPPLAVVRAAIGWLVGETLVPLAHSPALEALERDADGAVATVVRWTPRGVTAVEADDRDAAAIERAFAAIRAEATPASSAAG
jgi:hypothetical protein